MTSFIETLDQMREESVKSSSVLSKLSFANHLFDTSKKILEDHKQVGLEIPEDEIETRIPKMVKLLEQEALNIVKKLATAGPGGVRFPLPEAQFMLAEFIGKGMYGLKINLAQSFNLYLQASKQNHIESTFRVAICHELGLGIKPNNHRAIQFYRKASSLGHNLAMHKLALTLLYGKLGQKVNLKEGMSWLKRAANGADADHPEALHDLAQCFEKIGGCPIIISDEFYAHELYMRAANFGFAPSQFRIGACYELGLLGVEVDTREAIEWYCRAALQGYPEAELALAGLYLKGCDSVLNWDELISFKWVKKAAARQYPKAVYILGTYYERGIGVLIDPEEAKRLYYTAGLMGYKKAKERLVEMRHKESGSGHINSSHLMRIRLFSCKIK